MTDNHTTLDSKYKGISKRALKSSEDLLEDQVFLKLAIERAEEVRNGKSKLYTWEEVKASSGL